jgi:hypothetical protein
MANRCPICSSPARKDIEVAYVKGMTIPKIVQAYGVSEDSLRSHIKNGHISRQMITHYRQLDLHHNRNLLAEIDEILDYTKRILQRSYDKKSDYLALQKFEAEQQKEAERAEEKSDFENKLGVLTFAELEMLERLHFKVRNQSKEVIIPDREKLGGSVGNEEVDRKPLRRTRNNREMVRTK